MIRSKLLTGAALFLLAPMFFASDDGQSTGGVQPMPERIKAAVAQLDPNNDEHWTESGKPQMKAVEAILGVNVSRAEVNAAAPDMRRPEKREPRQEPDAPQPGSIDQLTAEEEARVLAAKRLSEEQAGAGPGEADPRKMDQAERERLADQRTRGAVARSEAARADSAGVTADEMSRRAAAKAALGEDDDRVEALAAPRADLVSGRMSRVRSREERIRQSDHRRLTGRAEHVQNSRIAAEHGAMAAPDFVSGRDIRVLDRYYIYGRFYEKGETVHGFVGRMPLKAVFV